jgi:hypothetical protein
MTLIEVIIACTILAVITLMASTMFVATDTTIKQIDYTEAAHNAASATLEACLTQYWTHTNTGFTTMHKLYNSFRIANPATTPKVSSFFEVKAPGLPAGNQYGTIIVREPTKTEAPRYNNNNGPRYAYANATNPYQGSSTALPGGGYSMSSTNEPKLYLIIVEVNIPALTVGGKPVPGRQPVRVRLQTLWLDLF